MKTELLQSARRIRAATVRERTTSAPAVPTAPKIRQPFSALLGAAFLLSQLACGTSAPRANNTPPASVAVQVQTVRMAPIADFYESAGTVRPRERAVIASKVTGTIREVSVHPGDLVRAGQPLIQIESDELKTDVAGAEAGATATEKRIAQSEKALEAAAAEARLAASTYQRYKELFDKRSISPHEFDQAEARRQSAEAARQAAAAQLDEARAQREQAAAALEGARIRKGYSSISAPFAAVVSERPVDPGTLAVPGMPLLALEKTADYRLEAALPESRLSQAKLGDSVRITIPAIELETSGRVVEIEPTAETASRTALVKISLPTAKGLRGGMFGRAQFSQGTQNLLAVPSKSVLRQGQLTSVFVVSNGVIRQRLVSLGRISGKSIEVLSGLSEGDQVVTSGVETLVDGTPAEVRP